MRDRSRWLQAGASQPEISTGHEQRTASSGTQGILFGLPINEPFHHVIGRYPYPARLNDVYLRQLQAACKCTLHEKGTVLFEEGEITKGVYIVLDGRVKLSATSAQGKALVLGIFGPGTVLGLAGTVLGRPCAVTAEVMQRSTAVFIARTQVLREIQSNVAAASQAAQLVSETCFFLLGKMTTVELAESAPQKMARCLLGLIAHNGNPDGEPEHLELTQEMIAQMVGLSRETVSRLLSRLRRSGVLDWTRSDFVIRNRRALEKLADLPEELEDGDLVGHPRYARV